MVGMLGRCGEPTACRAAVLRGEIDRALAISEADCFLAAGASSTIAEPAAVPFAMLCELRATTGA
eukprot:10442127-Lingulodinium_polyedra.AAC.1